MDLPPDDDVRWTLLRDGRNQAYNPLPVVHKLRDYPTEPTLWSELWYHLYHQGDVGTASCAAITHLAAMRAEGIVFNWNFYALMAAVEVERRKGHPGCLPDWLVQAYNHVWASITKYCVEDMATESNLDVLRGYLSVLALAKGHLELGNLLISLDASEIRECLAELRS